jgi:transcription termination factor Rho
MSEKKGRFEIEAEEFLDKQNIGELRAYGRHVGVEKPTELKKKALISAIIGIFLGEIPSVPRSKRGAPIRADYFNPKISETMDELYESYGVGVEPDKIFLDIIENVGQNTLTVHDSKVQYEISGVVEKAMRENKYRLHPYSAQFGDCVLFLEEQMMQEYKILEGDSITCKVREEYGGNGYFVKEIISVNGEKPHAFKRFSFEQADVYIPEKQIVLGGKSVVEKFVDWFAPLGAGQRYAIVAPSKSGRASVSYSIAKALCEREDLELLVVLVEQAPEIVSQYKRILGVEQLVSTVYGDDPEDVVNCALSALKRAKRYAEMGKDVVLLIDGLVELALAYNEFIPANSGKSLVEGLEGDTVRFAKKFFAQARNFFDDGSLTVINAVKIDNANPITEFLAAEFVDMANGKIVFDEELAKKRVFPAIDCMKSFSDQSEDLLGTEKGSLEIAVRRNIFSALSNEQVIELLEKVNTPEEFYKKAIEIVK